MDLHQQLELIRKNKHQDYLKQKNQENEQQQKVNEQLLFEKQIEILTRLAKKYAYLSNPRFLAAIRIGKFIKKHWFLDKCINEYDISRIPPIYRIRINITNYHLNSYTEENVTDNMLKMYRLMYTISHPLSIKKEPRQIFFKYCFDIRELHTKRNDILEIYDGFYFMQPEDHERIIACWKKVNNETNFSIKYLSEFEYAKSLTKDRDKEHLVIVTENRIREILSGKIDDEFDNEIVTHIIQKYVKEL